MKAKHARQIRKGILFARRWPLFAVETKAETYRQFVEGATPLEWRAFIAYRFRHWVY